MFEYWKRHWKKRFYQVRRIFSFLLALVMILTGFRLPTWADIENDSHREYQNYLDGWKVACTWSSFSNDYRWDAARDSMKQPKIVVTYRLDNADHAYLPGDIQFNIPGIGHANRAEIKKASDLASDAADSEWDCTWNSDDDLYTFSNKFSVEAGQSVSGGFQLLWTMQARESENGYMQKKSPVFRIAGSGQIEMEPLSYAVTSVRDRYRIGMTKKKLDASDYENADPDYIWYEIENHFDKDWLARGLYRSDCYIAVELPEGKDYSSVLVKRNGKTDPLTEITTRSGDTVWGLYLFQNRLYNIGSQYQSFSSSFQIGFLKDHFGDEEAEEYRSVTIRSHLDRLYYDDAQWISEAGEKEKVDDEVSFTIEDYSFTYSGYIYNHNKWNFQYEDYPNSHEVPAYTERLNAVNIYNGKIIQFLLKGNSNRNYGLSKAGGSSKAKLRSRLLGTGSTSSRITPASNSDALKSDSASLKNGLINNNLINSNSGKGAFAVFSATKSNASKSSELWKELPIPEDISDWDDIHWREHKLSKPEAAADTDSRPVYGELHSEQASDFDSPSAIDLPDEEPYVPDVTIWGTILNGLSQVENRIQKIIKHYAPIQAFAASTRSNAKKATAGSAENSSRKNTVSSSQTAEPTDTGSSTSGNTNGNTDSSYTGISQIGINGNSDKYSMVLGDDKLAIFLTDGSGRNLEDDEYDIAYVTIPKDSENYDYEVYGAAAQDTPFDEYVYYGRGNTSKTRTLPFPDGIKAMFVRVNEITGSYTGTAYLGVRLHLDWAAEQQKAADGEAIPDHENRLINFSYLRSLYTNSSGCEVNDCALSPGSYQGTYGRELAERDMDVYNECMLRSYSNVWLRSSITRLTSTTELKEFVGKGQNEFDSSVTAYGSIQSDDAGPLESFSLYTVIPDGLKFDLDTTGIVLEGRGVYASGDEAVEKDFENHVSYSIGEYDGLTMLIADFDFSDTPLAINECTRISVSVPLTLSYTNYISYGNLYIANSYLMVHDDGLDKIISFALMTDEHDINGNGVTTEQIAYSGTSKTVLDSAAEWREYVSKYVKSAYSKEFEAETVTRLYQETDPDVEKEKSHYSYRLDFGLGSDSAKNIDFFDRIEQGAKIALNEEKPNEYTTVPSDWQGKFVSVDTKYAQRMHLTPTVYYSTDPNQELAADADGWSRELPKDPGDVKSIWVHLDTSKMEDGAMHPHQMTYVIVNMQAPSDREWLNQYAVNQFYVRFDAYGIDSPDQIQARYELPSAETYVKLLDTVGGITLQKVDADNIIGTNENGTPKYAALTGAKFQIYDSNGNALLGDGQELNMFGQIILSNIPYGAYQWEEIEAPVGYQKIEGRHDFSVDGIAETLYIPNHRILGEVTLTKYDCDHKEADPLSDAEFELYKENGNQVFLDENGAYSENGAISKIISGKDGNANVTNLPWGNYIFIETKAPDGYEVNETPIKFTIGKNMYTPGADASEPGKIAVFVEAYDKETPASILLIKKDSSDGRAVKDAVFSLFRKKQNGETEDKLILSGLKTNAAGELQVDDLIHGEYYFVETRNPMGYRMPSGDEAITNSVTLDQSTAGRILEITHTNDRMKGSAVLTKYDDAGQLVAGAEYTLMYRAAEAADYQAMDPVYITNTDGQITVPDLQWGDYYFIEKKAPTGYQLSNEHVAFSINQDTVQSAVYITAVEPRQTGSVRLTKVDGEHTSLALSGAEYELYRTDGTKCKAGIDYKLPAGTDRIITGPEGTVTISELTQGGYYLQEVAAPDSYSLSDEKIRFSVTKENADVLQELTAEDTRNKVRLKINKRINEAYDPFGSPTFIFRICKKNRDAAASLQTYFKTITLASDQLEGSVSLTVEQGYDYEITELNAGRYKLDEITADTDNVEIDADGTDVDGAKTATADLTASDFAEVTFVNRITQYEKLSHTVNAANIIKTGAKLTGIRVAYHGPSPISEETEGYEADERTYTIRLSDVTVTTLYDDGSSYEAPDGSYTLINPVVDGSSNSYTGTVIYKEDGIERTGAFSIEVKLPEPWKHYWVILELNGGTIIRDDDTTMTAVEAWNRQVKEGTAISQPANEPQKLGYRFKGWFQDPSFKTPYDFASEIKRDTRIYAKWEADYDVKYAVALYEINDVDADGTRLPLTFGPASGADYRNTSISHIPADGEMCIHDMTWEEIIAQARKDPTVFNTCLKNSCTHSVLINMSDAHGNNKAFKGTSYNGTMDDGDGAANLHDSIHTPYRKWNHEHSTYYKPSSKRYQNSSNEGGWPDSAIRNLLNGTVTENMLTITNAGNDFDQLCLDESTALISSFPQVLQHAIYPRAVKSDSVYNVKTEANVVITHDKLWLLSPNEYFVDTYSFFSNAKHPLEGKTFTRQKMKLVYTANKIARLYTESGEYLGSWFRSLDSDWETNALSIRTVYPVGNQCQTTCGLAPCFSIR